MRQTINILDTGLFTCLLLGHYTKKPERTKAGVAKLSQHPLSVFLSFFFFCKLWVLRNFCNNHNPSLRSKAGVVEDWHHLLAKIWSFKAFMEGKTSPQHGFCLTHKALGHEGLQLRGEATKWHEKSKNWCRHFSSPINRVQEGWKYFKGGQEYFWW